MEKEMQKEIEIDLDFEKCLKIFNLNQFYTKKELEKEYQKRARKYHPDVNKSEEGKKKWEIISKGYKMLLVSLPEEETLKSANDIKNSFEDYPKDDFCEEKLDHKAFESSKLRKELFFNDSIPDPDKLLKETTSLKMNRENISVPIILDTFDQEEFNQVFEYNRRKAGVYNGNFLMDNNLGSFGETNYAPIQKFQDELVYDQPEYHSLFKEPETEFVFERKRCYDEPKYHSKTQAQIYAERDSDLVFNNMSPDDFERNKNLKEKKDRFEKLKKLKENSFIQRLL